MKFCLICNADKRQYYIYDYLNSSDIFPIMADAKDLFKQLKEYDKDCCSIVLPTPVSSDEIHIGKSDIRLADLIPALNDHIMVFGGKIPGSYKDLLTSKSIPFYDFLDDPDAKDFNAIATAEGAVACAIMESEVNLSSSKGLITGYGSCAKALEQRLKALGMNVTIAARNPSKYADDRIIDLTLIKGLSEYDHIFNTVPATVFNEAQIAEFKKDVCLIDIASKSGFDKKACDAYHLTVHNLPGLPGKVSPKSSGHYLGKYILARSMI